MVINCYVNPGHVVKFLFEITLRKVDRTGEYQAACKYFDKSLCVCFFLITTARLVFLLAIIMGVYDLVSYFIC